MAYQQGPPPAWAVSDPCQSAAGELCYGEITDRGLRRLISMLPQPCGLQPGSVFYDLGSGYGRVPAFISRNTNATRVRGIEVNGCRVRQARRRFGESNVLKYVHDDIRQVGFRDATVLYMAPQCWGSELLSDIFGTLARRAPRLQCAITFGSLARLQAIPALSDPFGHVAGVAMEISGTWDEHAAAILITRGGGCNGSWACIRRSRRWLASISRHVQDDPPAGPTSPWRAPSQRAWSELLMMSESGRDRP
jgi:SAM-dependent methyltransferase